MRSRSAKPLAAAGARDCTPPVVAGARGAPRRRANPATTGCPAAAAGVHSRANSEANGAAARGGDASLPRRYRPLRHRPRRHWQRRANPATTGCPAARRACATFVTITIMITIRLRLRSGPRWIRRGSRFRRRFTIRRLKSLRKVQNCNECRVHARRTCNC